MLTREHVIDEIKRAAAANGGVPLGREAFLRATGIKYTDWYGKFWARWSDAIREAGLSPNKMQVALPDELVLEKLVGLIREIGRFPSSGELRLKARNDPSFPTHNVFSRFGSTSALAERAAQYCTRLPELSDLAPLCVAAGRSRLRPTESIDEGEFGFVYLIKSGRFYKIGRTNAIGRREREIVLQLPDRSTTVHEIRTDDPIGIEAYWHKRFESRRKNGEWFELSGADLKAFSRRKFM